MLGIPFFPHIYKFYCQFCKCSVLNLTNLTTTAVSNIWVTKKLYVRGPKDNAFNIQNVQVPLNEK